MTSKTPEANLEAFHWLPVEQWSVDKIIAYGMIDGKRYCKICDEWVLQSKLERHVKDHIKEEKARRLKAKEDGLKKAQKARENKRKEKQMENEVSPAAPAEKPVQKKAANTSKPRAARDDSQVIQALGEALKSAQRATLVELSDTTGIDVQVVRQVIKKVPGAVVVDQVKTGKRGRPASIYGYQES